MRITKYMCGADCQTDHRLSVSKLNLTVQPQQHPQGPKLPKILNVAKLHNQETKEAIQSQLSVGLGDLSVDASDIGGSWHNFSNIVYSVSKEVLGTPNRKHQDWFDDQDADIQSRLHAKNQLFRSHLKLTPRKEMLILKPRYTYGACRMIGSAKSLRRSKHMLRQITPKSSTGPSMRFTTDSLQQALLR